MPLNLGSSAVSLYLGDQSVTGYLGSQIVTVTLPGAPTIAAATSNGINNTTAVIEPPSSDGGSPITGWALYVDGEPSTPDSITPFGNFVAATWDTAFGGNIQAAAINSIGEGPKSEPVAVVFD